MDRDFSLLTDLYEITMMNGYFKTGRTEEVAVFDVFFRSNELITCSVAAGLEQVVDYIVNLRFGEEELRYLKSLDLFDERFLGFNVFFSIFA